MKNSKALIYSVAFSLALSACAAQTATPLGNNMMQIDVSAAPVYGRAGAQRMALQEAARATVAAGYDKFLVVGSDSWTELQAGGASHGSFSATPMAASGYSSGGFSVNRAPEVKMVIKMFRYKDKGAANAVDAHEILSKKKK